MDIAQLILQTMEDSGVENPGSIGHAMLEMAKKASLPEEVDLDDELAVDLQRMKELENEKDLAWMDFPSWKCLSIPVQQEFSSYLNPLVYSGIYFSFKEFMSKKEQILKRLEVGTTINVQKTPPNYRFICLSSSSTTYDWFSKKELDKVKEWYERTKFLSIGRTITKGVIIKTLSLKKEASCKQSQELSSQ